MTKSLTEADVEGWLIRRVAELTGTKPESIDPDVALQTYGLTSLMAVEIAADAEDFLKIPVEATVAWDYPSISKLATYLWSEERSN